MSGGEHGAGAFIFESVGPGTYRAVERSSVPRQWTWEGDCRGEEILRLVVEMATEFLNAVRVRPWFF